MGDGAHGGSCNDGGVAGDPKPRHKRPPWRAIAALWVTGIAAVVVGLFVSPVLIAFGALFLLMTPFLFLFAAPPPPEQKHHYGYLEAAARAIERSGRSSRG